MNLIKQHIPAFIDGYENEVVPFETTEELLEIDFVKRFSTSPKFDHYTLSDSHLMCICDNGFSWWVVGTIMEPEKVDLPKWEGGKYRIINEACEVEVVSGDEVHGSRAGEVLLGSRTSTYAKATTKWYKAYRD